MLNNKPASRHISRHKKTSEKFALFIILLLAVIILIIFFFNQLSNKSPKNQPTELIGDVINYENKIEENWTNVEALLFTARQYYILSKEDDIYMSYFKYIDAIPDKFYIKTLYKLEKLGYKNIALLQDKFNEKAPDLKRTFMRALAYIIENMYEKSLVNYRKVEALSKNLLSARDYYYIGMIYYKKNEFYANAAIDYFKKAVDKGLKDAEIYLALSNAYFMLNQFDESIDYLYKADKRIEFNPIIKYNIAWILYNQKKYPESLNVCDISIKRLTRTFSKNKIDATRISDQNVLDNTVPVLTTQHLAKFYKLQGMIYNSQNNYMQAVASLKEAEKMLHSDDSIYELLGRVYYNQNHLSDAEIYLNKALELNPENTEAAELINRLKK